jgi:dephospho-CoA kinase
VHTIIEATREYLTAIQASTSISMGDVSKHNLGVGEVVVAVFSPARRSIVVRSLPRCLAITLFVTLGVWASPWIVKSLADVGITSVRPRQWIVGLGLAAVLWKIAYESLLQASRSYTLTSRRLLATSGVLRRVSVEIALERVQQVVLDRTLLERLSGLGTIGVTSAGSQMIDLAWVMVRRPGERLAQIRDALDKAAIRVRVVDTPCVRLVADAQASPAREKLQRPDKNREQLDRLRHARGLRPGVASTASTDNPAVGVPLIIGLAGGIGAGKSEVASILASLGALVTDSDKEAKAVIERPEVRARLVEWWGPGILASDGTTNRKAIAQIVFEKPTERARLEALVHPLVKSARDEMVARAAAAGVSAVVIDAPLLFEAGLDRECDGVIFVDTPREQRLARLKATRGWDEAELARREKVQLPLEHKKARSDVVVLNSGNVDDLKAQVARAYGLLLQRRGRGKPEDKGKP